MKHLFFALSMLALAATAPTATALADDDPLGTAIERVGQLQGMALHCKRMDEMTRIKKAVIALVPKTRDRGAAFEDATSAAYVEAERKRAVCPPKSEFNADIDAAIAALEATLKE